MFVRGAAAIALLAAGALLGAAAESLRATPRPPAGAPAVLGGFAALASQAVWIQADRAILRHEEDRAVTLLRTLVELQPEVVSASRYAAWEIGVNMLDGHEDPGTRRSLGREALRILDACVAANPRSAEARVHRARYLSIFVAGDAGLTADFRNVHEGASPLAHALDDYLAARDLDPGDTEAAAGAAELGAQAGIAAARDGNWGDAARALEAAVGGYDVILADARKEFGAAVEGDAPEAERYRDAEAARASAALLLEAARATGAARPALLDRFRAAHPGVLDAR